MKEIKFRAFQKSTKIMLPVNSLKAICTTSERLTEEEFDDLIITQSTGLFDKNGKEIFEGDIVKGFYNYSTEIKKAVIKFRIGRFEVESFKNISIDEFLLGNETNLEIIGNIYENPELLTF